MANIKHILDEWESPKEYDCAGDALNHINELVKKNDKHADKLISLLNDTAYSEKALACLVALLHIERYNLGYGWKPVSERLYAAIERDGENQPLIASLLEEGVNRGLPLGGFDEKHMVKLLDHPTAGPLAATCIVNTYGPAAWWDFRPVLGAARSNDEIRKQALIATEFKLRRLELERAEREGPGIKRFLQRLFADKTTHRGLAGFLEELRSIPETQSGERTEKPEGIAKPLLESFISLPVHFEDASDLIACLHCCPN